MFFKSSIKDCNYTIQEYKSNIRTLEKQAASYQKQLNKILNWIGKVPLTGHIGIIGGEPTLHHQFKEILYIMSEFCDKDFKIYTVYGDTIEEFEFEELMPYGLCIGTHHTNATGTLENYPEVRGVCVDEAVNYNKEIYAELICDRIGAHVLPYMQRLVRKIKGDDRIILISDAYACDGPIPDGYDDVDDINFDHAGEIAGSKLTLDVACRNMMKHTGASIVDVFRYASTNPSKAVGFTDRGEIREGLRADLVICDHRMNIKTVILKGEVQ